ncbi:hypothetical protein L7F22_056665 [Adiantum nelumboides]|nr:hypothetical protein [Adiantum nelumboides]
MASDEGQSNPSTSGDAGRVHHEDFGNEYGPPLPTQEELREMEHRRLVGEATNLMLNFANDPKLAKYMSETAFQDVQAQLKATTTSPLKPDSKKQYSEKEMEEELDARLARILGAQKQGKKHDRKRKKSTNFNGYLGSQSTFDKAKKHKKYATVPSSSSSSESSLESSEEERSKKRSRRHRHGKGKRKSRSRRADDSSTADSSTDSSDSEDGHFYANKKNFYKANQYDFLEDKSKKVREFKEEHSKIRRAASYLKGNARTWWSTLLLNKTAPVVLEEAHSEAEKIEKTALKPNDWISFKLEDTVKVSPNTNIYRFTFDDDEKLGLNVASCLLTRAQLGNKDDGKPNYVIRPYTPISPPDSKGYFDLMVKVYPQGKMSRHIGSLKPGDTLEVKGPIPKIPYKPNMKKNIGMVAGGTGITPMLQVIDAILSNKDDLTKIYLIYANISPEDILLKDKLDLLAAENPNFKVFYVVDKPSSNWNGGSGFITKDMVLKGMPTPSDDTLILVCGPPGMMKHISGDKAPDKSQGEVSGLLKEAGYSKDMVYKF